MIAPDFSDIEAVPGEPLRYRVASRSRATSHMVDMANNRCFGQCGCEQFACRLQPRVNEAFAAGRWPAFELRCHHIKRVVLFIAHFGIEQLAKTK